MKAHKKVIAEMKSMDEGQTMNLKFTPRDMTIYMEEHHAMCHDLRKVIRSLRMIGDGSIDARKVPSLCSQIADAIHLNVLDPLTTEDDEE